MSMKTPLCLLTLAGLVVLAIPAGSVRAGSKETATLEASCEVVDALGAIPLKSIPPALFKEAQGVAIIPGVFKAGFVIGGRHGRGVFLLREQVDCWSRPMFITLTGGSIGWQAGVQSTDLVLLFRTRTSVDRILKGKSKVTLGGDLAVAAGPVGRQAEAATDVQLKAEIYSYSRTRGLFAGLSLEGAALMVDSAATDAYYRSLRGSLLDPMTGRMIPLTPPDEALRLKLATLGATWVAPPLLPLPPPPPPAIQPQSPPLVPPPPPAPPPEAGRGQ
jgi:lipid-binding SYLF domain-containing protein